MKLRDRLYLAALLTPAFWLLMIWMYVLSPGASTIDIVEILLRTFAISFVCAYCVTLFVMAYRKLNSGVKH
jgi:ferritin-like protein